MNTPSFDLAEARRFCEQVAEAEERAMLENDITQFAVGNRRLDADFKNSCPVIVPLGNLPYDA